jgi:TIR domain-containing protein
MAHVFISYTTKNWSIADRLRATLERNGVRCWIASRDIPAGFAWPERIVTAMSESAAALFIVSKDAYRSGNMAHELELADGGNVPILPIRLDTSPLQGPFKYFLSNKQWLDLEDGSPERYEAVVSAVRAVQAERDGRSPGEAASGPALVTKETAAAPASRQSPRIGAAAVVDELRTVVMTFVDVFRKREETLAGFDLTDPGTLFFAFRFLIYLSVGVTILHVPAWSVSGIQAARPAFVLSIGVAQLLEQLAFCVVVYAAIRLFGGHVDARQFAGAFCLLAPYQLLADACLIPVQVRSIAAQNTDLDAFFGHTAVTGAQLSAVALAVLFVALASSIAFRIVFLVALFRTFRITTQVGVARSAMALVAGGLAWIVALLVLVQPFEANVYEALGRH